MGNTHDGEHSRWAALDDRQHSRWDRYVYG
jgi:hypothetical protein